MRRVITFLALCLAISCGVESPRPESQEQVLAALKEGNARFVEGEMSYPHTSLDYTQTLSSGQSPFATVVACSDSRVPVEFIFDQGFGDIFVIRNAGNTVLDKVSLGSVEYSVNHLDVNTVVVLGHTSCGAVTGVVMAGDSNHHIHGDENVTLLLDHIAEHISQHKGTNENLDQAILDNINVQVDALMLSENIKSRVEAGELQILPALYDISTGGVTFLTAE
ncbi:MAG: carbonic anhydrase [Rikenellaceae bacterium]